MWDTLSGVLALCVVLLGLGDVDGVSGDCSKMEEFDSKCFEPNKDVSTQYFVWIGIVSGMAVFVVVVFVSCVCCRCCLLHKRRREHEAFIAATVANRDFMSANIRGPTSAYPVQRPRGPGPYIVGSASASEAEQHIYANAPPVFPDEPPPKYTP